MKFLFEWLSYPLPLKVWIGFLVLFPFYFMPSGLPQIADWLLAGLVASEVGKGLKNHHPGFDWAMKPLWILVAYIAAVSLIWLPISEAVAKRPTFTLLVPVFYFYNAAVVMVLIRLALRFGNWMVRATVSGVVMSLLFQLCLIPVGLTTGFRDSLFFNNPNQLGYYALLALSMLFLLDRHIRIPAILKITCFTAGTMLAAISASKAAVGAAMVLVAVNLLDSGLVRLNQLVGAIAALVAVLLIANNTEIGNELTTNVYNRMSSIGTDGDDNAAVRGYDRMWMFPEHMILGAGEGGWERFYEDKKRQYEMHSSFGTLLFSYGIPGFVAFWVFVYRVFRYSTPIEWLYSLPIFAYGVTHMGLRFTLFWVFFALVLILNEQRRVEIEFQVQQQWVSH